MTNTKNDTCLRLINEHLEQAEKLLMGRIEKEVKKVLEDPNIPATGFISCMGGYFWIDESDSFDDDLNRYPWQLSISQLYDEYDHIFKMSGAGIRWDLLDGKVLKLTNW